MKNPLDPKVMDEREAAKAEASYFDALIEDRIGFILDTVFSLFGEKKGGWYFPDAEENETGDFEKANSDPEWIDVVTHGCLENGAQVKLADGKYFNPSERIPYRWLFESFEEELKEARQRYIDEKEEKKRKSQEKKANRKVRVAGQAKLREHQKEIMKAVENKLTPEELAVLRMKIKA